MISELVVISGKGGTGKTSVVASFAALADNAVLVDCDVDASDLHLILDPRVVSSQDFSGGMMASIRAERCTGCGICEQVCRFEAVSPTGPANEWVDATYSIDPVACEGCGVCVYFCPSRAIDFTPAINGQWFVSESRFGPMVHARLGVAEENSGKLVTTVRNAAKKIAEASGRSQVIIDGSPGIGCPVIASLTGAAMALIVTEPTLSGMHDLDRVAELTSHFRIPTGICVNKCDIHPEMTETIRERAEARGMDVLGVIPYDAAVTHAQIAGKSVVEFSNGPAASAIESLWNAVRERIPAAPKHLSIQTKGQGSVT